MTMHMKGNLSEEACCHHMRWSGDVTKPAYKPYPLPGHKKHYAPDMPFHVRHVKLVVEMEPTKGTLSGLCHTTVSPVGKPISEVFFEAEEMSVTAAMVGGKKVAFEQTEKGYTVKLDTPVEPGKNVMVTLSYSITNPRAGMYFTGPDKTYKEPYQVWTQGQDEDAHYWFPVAGADFPNHKMTSEVVCTVPERFTAISNGKLICETVDQTQGLRTFHWLLDKPHVTYLMALVVGVFVKLEKMYKDVPVQLYCDPELVEDAKGYFEDTEKLVALYSRLYGVEYPWPGKYAQVMARRYIFGGMENTTITIMTDRIVADATTRKEFRRFELRLNAHELNHHWNGDDATCRDWSHGHLNEGGATYGEVEMMEHFYGKLERDFYVHGLALQYFGEDKGRYRRPIVSQHYGEPIDLFDSHLYKKGALVRHMLRYLLTDEGYYSAVKTYLTDNAYGSVETIDWIKAIEKATGRNMRKFFDQWVYGAGFPEYGVKFSWDEKTKVASVNVTQNQKLEQQTGLFSMPIVFSFGFADGSKRDFTVNVDEKEHSFHFALDQKPAMFRFDPENWILKTVDLQIPKSMLLHQLANDSDVMGRIYAIQALEKIGDAEVVSALEKAIKSDFFWGVGQKAAQALGTIRSDAAKKVLMAHASHSDDYVRRAVVNALGNFEDEAVAELLVGIVSGAETSTFVKADAAMSLGRTKSKMAFEPLKNALDVESWNHTIRIGALNGLAALGDERGIELALAHSGEDKPFHARPAAFYALGSLAAKQPNAVEHLHALAKTEDVKQFTLFTSLIGALGSAKSKTSVPVLEKLKADAYDGRVKRMITDVIGTLQSSEKSGQSNDELKAQVEKLTTQLKELTEQLNAHTVAATHHAHEAEDARADSGHNHEHGHEKCGKHKRGKKKSKHGHKDKSEKSKR